MNSWSKSQRSLDSVDKGDLFGQSFNVVVTWPSPRNQFLLLLDLSPLALLTTTPTSALDLIHYACPVGGQLALPF